VTLLITANFFLETCLIIQHIVLGHNDQPTSTMNNYIGA